MLVGHSMSILIFKNIVEPMYYACPIFDVDFYSRENHRADV